MNIWKQRYDEMIVTCAHTGKQRDEALEKLDQDLLGKYGCPNCEGEGLADLTENARQISQQNDRALGREESGPTSTHG